MVRLTDHTTPEMKKKYGSSIKAMDEVADAGGSARAQLDAARKSSGEKRLSYNAHIGDKQARKNLERLAKKCLPCPICHGVEGCDHTFPERKEAWRD